MKKKHLLALNLQQFSEPGEGGNPEPTPPGTEEVEFDVNKLTDEQVDSLKEKFGFKTDEDVNKLIDKKYAKWLKETEERENEAARLAKLSKDEREQEAENKRLKEIEEREKNVQRAELMIETRSELEQAGLPVTFAEMVIADKAEDIKVNIEALKVTFDEAVEQAVNLRLVNKPTKIGGEQGDLDPFEAIKQKYK